jgi:deazaflavin-dependent oxidoreductase (nitroreductase family)
MRKEEDRPAVLAREKPGFQPGFLGLLYDAAMSLEGDYEPSPSGWVREQVDTFERSGGREGNTLRDTGLPIVVLTMRGHRSGKLRKTPVMRVEHDGQYAIVASKGGSPDHPLWYFNLKANPDEVRLQDGSQVFDVSVREVDGEERRQWWDRAVAAYPPYAEYQEKTQRQIPVFVTSASP